MKNLLKKKAKKFNSKKGFTLVELIVGIMILLVVVSASVRGITISYRSAMLGAAKNDAQSIAQRNCDIIMTAIVTNVEKTAFVDVSDFDGMFTSADCDYFDVVYQSKFGDYDMRMHLPDGGYDKDQYADAKNIRGSSVEVEFQQKQDLAAAISSPSPDDDGKKYQYYTVEMVNKKIGTTDFKVFYVTTYVYYTDKGYVTCQGEVSVLPKSSI